MSDNKVEPATPIEYLSCHQPAGIRDADDDANNAEPMSAHLFTHLSGSSRLGTRAIAFYALRCVADDQRKSPRWAFEPYWRKIPSVKRLVFKVIPEETTSNTSSTQA